MNRAAAVGVACLAALALAGCAATPAEEDPVQIKLKDMNTRLERIERVVANQSLLELSNQVESLRGDVRAMHNDVDVLGHNLEAARKQQRDLYADLDQRIKALEGRSSVAGASGLPVAAATAGATASSSDGADKVSYQAAFELLKNGQYEQAIAAFQSFLKVYSNSQLVDNAQYWLGEAYYVNKSFTEALAAFQRVVENYPQSRKVSDALLKTAYCDYELKQFTAAREVFTRVAAQYPDTAAAGLAKQRLEKMADGH